MCVLHCLLFVGFDSAATEVATLVARAFQPMAERQTNYENDIDDGEDDDQRQSYAQDSDAMESESMADDGAQPSFNGQSATDNIFANVNGNFMGNMLRIIGLDNGKLGAMAMNGLIFIAQIVSIFIPIPAHMEQILISNYRSDVR